jgi:hypothetical protein
MSLKLVEEKLKEKLKEELKYEELEEIKFKLFYLQYEGGLLLTDNQYLNKILDLEEKVFKLIETKVA